MAEALLAKSVNGSRIADFINIHDFRKGHKGEDRSDWMTFLPTNLAERPLTEIAIPGSHDSFTALLDPDGPIGPTDGLEEPFREAINIIHSLLQAFPGQSTPASKKIIYNWGVTQSLTLSDQLKAGIRYFDFRIATKDGSTGTHLIHTLYAQSTRGAFMEINTFLDKHPKEIVIIDLNHFYHMQPSNHEELISEISNIFGKKLVPEESGFYNLTPKKLWKKSLQVIISYHNSGYAKRESVLWNGGKSVKSPWPNTNDQNKAFRKLNRWTKERAQKAVDTPEKVQHFWVTQGILTPTAYNIAPATFSEILNGILNGDWSSIKRELGSPMCSAISDWLKSQRSGRGGINIVIADFVEESDFIPNVLALNH